MPRIASPGLTDAMLRLGAAIMRLIGCFVRKSAKRRVLSPRLKRQSRSAGNRRNTIGQLPTADETWDPVNIKIREFCHGILTSLTMLRFVSAWTCPAVEEQFIADQAISPPECRQDIVIGVGPLKLALLRCEISAIGSGIKTITVPEWQIRDR